MEGLEALLEAGERLSVDQLRVDLRKWDLVPGRRRKNELVQLWAAEALRRGIPARSSPRSASPHKRRARSRSPRSPRIRLSMPPLEPLESPAPAQEALQKKARTEEPAAVEVAATREPYQLLPAAGLAASVALLAGMALLGAPQSGPPDEMVGFVEALSTRAAAFHCGAAETAFLAVPESLRNRTLPAHVRLLDNGALAQATQYSLPLLCRARLAFFGSLPYVAVAATALVGLWLWVRRRQTDAETLLFAQQLAAFVEAHLAAAQGEAVFVDIIKQLALAPQMHLSKARREQVWQLTEKLVRANPRVFESLATHQGEQCTTWRLSDL